MGGPSDRVDETLGQYLKRMRESRRISREKLAATTRISLAFIRALEEDNFRFFSLPEQIPGYLQLYARDTGLDYADVLNRYQKQRALCRDESEAPRSRILRRYVNTPIQTATDTIPPLLNRPRMSSGWLAVICIIPAALIIIGLMVAPVADPFTMLVSSINALRQKEAPDKTVRHSTAAGLKEIVPPAHDPVFSQQLSFSKTLQERNRPTTAEITGNTRRDASETLPNQGKVIIEGNRDSRRYHLPGMMYYGKIAAHHRVEFASEAAAIKAGYHKASR